MTPFIPAIPVCGGQSATGWGAIWRSESACPRREIPAIRRHYFETYGTTLRGLQKHHQVDTDDYLAYVHDLPLEQYIQPNPALHDLLVSLPQRRFIFTNADAATPAG